MIKKNKLKYDVSVIVPMYNVENLIQETIASIKKNNCLIQVILVNDGSTDSTLDKVADVIDGDVRFVILSQKNKGVSAARNYGLRRATGKYVVFVDSDDLLLDGAIDLLFNAAIENQADFVYGGIKKFNTTSMWTIPIHDKLKTYAKGLKKILQNPEIFYSMGPAGKLIKRSLINNIEFPKNISCAEDQVFFFNVFVNAKRIYSLGEYIYFYRERDISENDPSITQQRDIKAFLYFKDILIVMEMIRKINNDALYIHDQNKDRNLSSYYERAITFDVWPLLIRVLKYHPKYSSEAFSLLTEFINQFDEKFISNTPAFRYFFIRVFSDQIFHIKSYKAFQAYRDFLKVLFNKLDPDIHTYCSQEKVYGHRWLHSHNIVKKNKPSAYLYFLILSQKKKFFFSFNKNKQKYIKEIAFPLFKLFPVDKNKIVFATVKKGKASSNFESVLTELRVSENTYKVKKFLGASDTLKRKLYRYYHLATASVIILDDYYHPLYGLKLKDRTKVFQLWHACGCFKKFGLSALGKDDANTEEFELNAHKTYTHVIGSSPKVAEAYSEAFGLSAGTSLGIGVPRTDLFFKGWKRAQIIKSMNDQYPMLKDKYKILYAPTFRGRPSKRKTYNVPFDFSILDELPFNYQLILKLHPVVNVSNIKIPDAYKDRVLIAKSDEDVNYWMIYCDVLVTDYSSLVFEYSLLDKPIVYYAYDLDSYFQERGFYHEFQKYVYGDVALTQYELSKMLRMASDKQVFYDEQRKRFKDYFMSSCDGQATKRLLNSINGQI